MKIALLVFMLVFLLEFSFSEHSCTPKRFYCGHQVSQAPQKQRAQNMTLWQCESDGKSLSFSYPCIYGCKAAQGGDSYCLCLQNKYYCGHELLQHGWDGYENHTLYECDDHGLHASPIENCSVQCKATPNRGSFCFRGCQDGQNYCGYRLKELGWEGYYDNHSIYHCHGGKDISILSNCTPRGLCNVDLCNCFPGRFYCGHELYDQLGWDNFKSDRIRIGLFKCGSNGTYVSFPMKYNCQECISGDQLPNCDDCQIGNTYCGSDLLKQGLVGYKNNTLYLCEQGHHGSRLTEVMPCDDGKCDHDRCDCTRGKLYCGHELYKMGWRQLTSVGNQPWLGRCRKRKKIDWIANCSNCHNTGTGSKCNCISGINYCGSKINQMGYRGYNNDSIYLCKDTQSSLADTGEMSILCSHNCIPGRSYCGYELQYFENIEKDDLQRRYICNDDKSFQSTSLCGKCITNVVTGASCHCLPGWRHCASVIHTSDWKDFGESLAIANLPKNFTNDTIFWCKDEENVEYIESCARNECQYKGIGAAYCVCSPDRTYCGHELYEHYNSMHTKLDSNYIYRCSETATTVIEQERCRKCLRLYGKPYCRHEFSTLWFVGGIVALVCFSFGFVLIRTILKHRRLKKLMERKRINVAQLTVSKKKLGQGQFGEVWQGTYTNSEGNLRDVALKLSKGRIDATNCFLQEVMSLDIVSHQNIIKVFGVCLNFRDQGGNSVPALVLEYMNGGSAIAYMRSERNRLIGRDLLRIFLDICQAGDHLCKLGFIHRDIAARNVLVQTNPQTGHVIVAKLTDFGLAKDIGKLASMYKDTSHDQTRLPFRYLAPEGFECCFCFKSDVWSFGVFMWELYTVMEEEEVLAELRLEQARSGPVPYSELNSVADVLAEAYSDRKLKQPKMTPNKMYEIMRHCWAIEPESRPNFEELINSFNINGNESIIEQRMTFLPSVSSDKNNGAHSSKDKDRNSHQEKDKKHDQNVYATP